MSTLHQFIRKISCTTDNEPSIEDITIEQAIDKRMTLCMNEWARLNSMKKETAPEVLRLKLKDLRIAGDLFL